MEQNEKTLEQIFEAATASPEELEQAKGGVTLAAPRQVSSDVLGATSLTPATQLSPALVADLSSFFNRGLGSLDGGLVFRPDQDTGH